MMGKRSKQKRKREPRGEKKKKEYKSKSLRGHYQKKEQATQLRQGSRPMVYFLLIRARPNSGRQKPEKEARH
jgi:hypothetical protein